MESIYEIGANQLSTNKSKLTVIENEDKIMKAIILFGHGARDARWREPFDRLAKLWQEQYPDTPVQLAFLEMMQPSLEEAVVTLSTQGAIQITVVPVFFGQGGHLRNDFPVLLDACRVKFPAVTLTATHAVGEDLAVLQAIVDFGVKSSQ